jgi:hypothetical protein
MQPSFWSRLFLAFAVIISLKPVVNAQQTQRAAELNFRVVDRFGRSLPYQISQLIAFETKRDLAKGGSGTRVTDVPFGKYAYRLQRTDHPYVAPLQGDITIDQAELWITRVSYSEVVVVDGKVAEPLMSSPLPFSFRGLVRWSRPSDRPVAVRLQPAFEGAALEVGIDSLGTFRMVGYFRGLYTISVFGNDGMLYTSGIVFFAMKQTPEQLVIDLSKRVSDTIIVE